MRWLVDECVPVYVVDWLRERGDDVLDVADSPYRSQSDRFLWQLAGRESRTVVTRDLGFLWPGLMPAPDGVVMIRVPDDWQAQAITRLVSRSLDRLDTATLAGNVTVIEPGRIRQRPLAHITWR